MKIRTWLTKREREYHEAHYSEKKMEAAMDVLCKRWAKVATEGRDVTTEEKEKYGR